MNDITNFVNWFISAMVDLFTFIFNTLDSISFLGITLLDYITTIFILSVALPLVVTLLRAHTPEIRRSRNETKHENRNKAETNVEEF